LWVKPTKLVWFYQEECDAVIKTKKFLSTEKDIKSLFLRKMPEEDFIEQVGIDKNSTVIIVDDFAPQTGSNEKLREILLVMSQIWVHHYGIILMYSTQSFEMFLKSSKLNPMLNNSTHLILFKTSHEARSLRRYLKNYLIPVKGDASLWTLFEKHVQSQQYQCMVICISTHMKRPTVFTNVMMSQPGPVLSFHESSESELSDDGEVDAK